MTKDKIDYTKLKHLVVTVGSEKDYCLPGPVPTCLEWVYCFQARHVSKLRNYPATDQHDKVRVRQVRATPAAAEVRGRGGLLQSEAVVREALAWEEGTGTGTDLCCEPLAYMSMLKQQATHVWKVKTWWMTREVSCISVVCWEIERIWNAANEHQCSGCEEWSRVHMGCIASKVGWGSIKGITEFWGKNG